MTSVGAISLRKCGVKDIKYIKMIINKNWACHIMKILSGTHS